MKRGQVAAHTILAVVGVTLLVSAAIFSGPVRDVLISLGTTVLGVPIASGLLLYFAGDPFLELRSSFTSLISQMREGNILVASGQRAGVKEIFGSRSEIPIDFFARSSRTSKRRIWMLAYAMEFIVDNAEILNSLRERAKLGCDIKILLGDPSGHFVLQRDTEEATEGSIPSRIETSILRFNTELGKDSGGILRLFDAPLYTSIYIFDDELIACPALYGRRGSLAPALRITVAGTLFDRYVEQFETMWNKSKIPTSL